MNTQVNNSKKKLVSSFHFHKLKYLYLVTFAFFSLQFDKVIQSCEHHHNQDIEGFHHQKKFPHAIL